MSVLKLSSLRANLEREQQGDWVDSLRWAGVRFRVRALTTPSYRIKRDPRLATLSRKYKGKPIPPEVSGPILGRLYAEEILLGWEGLDIAYSPEVALETLSDPAYRELVSEIEWCAGTLSEVDAEYEEETAKNSVRPSADSSKNAAKSQNS